MLLRVGFVLVCCALMVSVRCRHIPDDDWGKYFDVYKHHFQTGMQTFPQSERQHKKEELVQYFDGEIERPEFFELIAATHVDLLNDAQKAEFVDYVKDFDITTLPEDQTTGKSSPHFEGHPPHEGLTGLLSHISDNEWHKKYFPLYKQHFETGMQTFEADKRSDSLALLIKYLKGECERPDFFEHIADRHVKLLDDDQLAEFIEFLQHFDLSTLPSEQISRHPTPHAHGHVYHPKLTALLTHISGHDWHQKYSDIYKQHFRTGMQKFPVSEREHIREELIKYMKDECERPPYFEPIADRHVDILDGAQKVELIEYIKDFDLSTLPEHQITISGSPHAEGHSDHQDLTSLLSRISHHDWQRKYFPIFQQHFKTGMLKFPVEDREDGKQQMLQYLKEEIDRPGFIEPVADRHLKLLDKSETDQLVNFIEHFDLSTLPEDHFTAMGSPHAEGHEDHHELGRFLNHMSGDEWHNKYSEIYQQHFKTGMLRIPSGERVQAKDDIEKYLKGLGERPSFFAPIAVKHIQLLDEVQLAELISFIDHFDVSTLPEEQTHGLGSPHMDGHKDHRELTAYLSHISRHDWNEKYFGIFKQHLITGLQKYPVGERQHILEELLKYAKGQIKRPSFFALIADKHMKLLDYEQLDEFISYAEHLDVSTLPEHQFTGEGSPHAEGHVHHHELTGLLTVMNGYDWFDKYFPVYKQHFRTGMQKFPVEERQHNKEELLKFLKGEIERPEFFAPIAYKHIEILDPAQLAEFIDYIEHCDVSTLDAHQITGKGSPHAEGHHDHYELTDHLSHISGHDWHEKYFDIFDQHLRTGLQKFPVAERQHAKEQVAEYLKGHIEKPSFFEPIADRHLDLMDAAQKAEFIKCIEELDVSTLPEEQITEAGAPHSVGHTDHHELNTYLRHIPGHEWRDKYYALYKQHFKTGMLKFPVAEREDKRNELVKYFKGEIERPEYFEPIAAKHVGILDGVQNAEFVSHVMHFDLSTLPETQFTEEGSPHADGHTSHDKLTVIAETA